METSRAKLKKSDSQAEDEELQERLREAFDKVDVDKNGFISRKELKLLFGKSGYKATDKAIKVM